MIYADLAQLVALRIYSLHLCFSAVVGVRLFEFEFCLNEIYRRRAGLKEKFDQHLV